MSDDKLLEEAATERANIVEELWVIVADDTAPAAAKVGALDKIAKIAGAYKPAPTPNKNRFRSLAEFYQDIEPDSEDERNDV